MLVTIVTVIGLGQVSVDRDLRNIFRGESDLFAAYSEAAELYTDSENQELVLIEGTNLGEATNFEKLRDLHLDLSLLPNVGNIFSVFSLRNPPDENDNTTPFIADPSAGLQPPLIAAIRSHPLLGQSVVNADGTALLFVITHAESQAPLVAHDRLIADIQEAVEQVVAGTEMSAVVTGFAPMRSEIVRLLQRDQIALNGFGVIIGFLLSFLLFRSLHSAIMIAAPAAFAGVTILGWTGALGLEATILSTIIPALVMVLGYADGMHLTSAWQRFRRQGYDVVEAERLALIEVGPACFLTAMTTSVAFLSMTFSDLEVVRSFGWIGAFAAILATSMVLIGHGLAARLLGRFWKVGGRSAHSPIIWLSSRCSSLAGWVVQRAWVVAGVAGVATIVAGLGFASVDPDHTLSEALSDKHPMVEALVTIDRELGGSYAVQIVVPMNGLAPDSAAGLAQIRAVHEAVAEVPTGSPPLSLWSLAVWSGTEEGGAILDWLPEGMRPLFVSPTTAVVTVYIPELPTPETNSLIDAIEAAAEGAVEDTIVTGPTVIGARESQRTIGDLNINLGIAILVALTIVALALRSAGAGLVAAIPNILPIFSVGALLYVLGDGMQLTSIVSLTIAFGIAIDDTIHYLNAVFLTQGADVKQRVIEASGKIGPVLIGTTLVLIGGLAITQTSGLSTIALFGMLLATALTVAVISDLVFLPAILAGPARRLLRFEQNGRAKDTD
ncbi:MAG: efflux RND transporter permease subunit [Alphaproteobacteria bacterium]